MATLTYKVVNRYKNFKKKPRNFAGSFYGQGIKKNSKNFTKSYH